MKPKVLVIVGPTAVGKTKLSIELAKEFNGEIISGDSMQVYKGMDIGTAKITKEETEGIPHYMIDIKEPKDPFSVADFKSYVTRYIDEILSRNKLPIIVGGSGLYIQSIMYDYQFAEMKRDDQFTKELEKKIAKDGIQPIYKKLQQVDPDQAEKIHPNNHRRVIRALEVYEQTGLTMSEMTRRKTNQKSPFEWILIGLKMDRELLYERINQRVDEMVHNGLEEEVYGLFKKGFENTQAMRAIGYKEFIPYFKKECHLNQAVDLLKRNSRRYAKRQLTWFRNKMNVNWYTMTSGNVNRQIQIILKDLAGLLKDT